MQKGPLGAGPDLLPCSIGLGDDLSQATIRPKFQKSDNSSQDWEQFQKKIILQFVKMRPYYWCQFWFLPLYVSFPDSLLQR